ncbi:MAG: hypothetical protein RL563_599, partial [Pseudomonadota bacterium]
MVWMSKDSCMFNKLTALLTGKSELWRNLAGGAIASILIKIANTGLNFLLAVLLARALGPEGYGLYAYVFSVIMVLAVPAEMGLPQLVVRETAKAQSASNWGLMRGLWRWAGWIAGLTSVMLAVLSLTAIGWVKPDFNPVQLDAFMLGLVLVPLVALGNLRGAALRGLRKTILGQLPELLLQPGSFLLMILGVMFVYPERLTPAGVMGINALAAGMAFLIGAVLLWRVKPSGLQRSRPRYEKRAWFAAVLPLAFVSGMQLINNHTAILLLGYFKSPAEVGIFKVVSSCSGLVA